MPQSQRVELACPHCRSTRFEISVLKDEGVAAARCLKCNRNYLLLDSGDYWFDVRLGVPELTRSAQSPGFLAWFAETLDELPHGGFGPVRTEQAEPRHPR